MSSDAVVGVFQDESGLVLVGDEADVLDVIRHLKLPSEHSLRLPPDLLSKAGAVFLGIGEIQSQSGRWLKLTDESMAGVQQLGFSRRDRDPASTSQSRISRSDPVVALNVRVSLCRPHRAPGVRRHTVTEA